MPHHGALGHRHLIDPLVVLLRGGRVELLSLAPDDPWEVAPAPPALTLETVWALWSLRTGHPLAERFPGRFSDGAEAAAVAQLERLGLLVDAAADQPAPPHGVVNADDRIGDADTLVLRQPLPLWLTERGATWIDHEGVAVTALDPDELWCALAFAAPTTVSAARAHAATTLGDQAPSAEEHGALVRRLAGAGLLLPAEAGVEPPVTVREQEMRDAIQGTVAFQRLARAVHATHDAHEAERRERTGVRRTKVVPVQSAGNVPPLSTGMVLAYARAFEGGRLHDHYDLHPRWIVEAGDAPDDPDPVLYLFTNYLWSHERNLEVAAQIKAAHPRAITIHGGPDCPTYPGEDERYLRRLPQVDVVVRGEGERTAAEVLAALGPTLSAGSTDLSALRDVAGVTFRDGDSIVRTADRPRIEDVDTIPSPYLDGIFDAFGATRQVGLAIIETNRGCPYGCTFCDWGSATNSRIRKFDLDRVLAEFTWCAEHAVPKIFVADANFGIFSRDVEIAQHVVELHRTYGYPQRFITNYAKNTVKHLKEIVSTLAGGGILTEGLMSLQSMDAETLRAIRRSNIKLDRYEALSTEFRQAGLPLFVDLMMGLPGQTVDSLRGDLQQCVDREVNAKCHATELLVNSPMNDPDYRAEHRLEISRDPGVTGRGVAATAAIAPAFVVSSATFTRADYREMHLMRRSYLLSENFGVLRQVSRFVRQETGIGEVALIEQLRAAATDDPGTWPLLALALIAGPDAMVPPGSWAPFIAEVRRYLVEVVGVAPGADLDAILDVQLALLPASGRSFPVTLELAHDVAAWHRAIIGAKDDGHVDDWPSRVPRLAEHPAAAFTVDDPLDVSHLRLGIGSAIDAYQDWELDSPVARAMPGHARR